MRKTKYHIKKKIMPLLLAVAMAGTATPIYVAHPAIVKAAVSNAFGTNKISLSAGSYTVPVSLKKADNVEQNSMAAGAVGKNATLEVAEDGTASLEVELKALNLYGMTGAAKDLKVYQGNDIKSETKDVTVEETDEAGNPTKIKFTIPESAKTTDGKVTDLQIKGENFEGKYAKENENIYLPKAINKIKDQIQGLDITNQNSFDKVDTVSGATTSASAIKNAVMESLGLTSKEEVLAPAPETVEEGTYGIQMKNMTSTVEHSLSAANSENKVTATLKVDKNRKMTLSYPVVTKEAMDVLAFNGYYNGSDLTKEGSEETKDGESVTTVNMPLTGDKPDFKLYVPAMSNLSGEHGGITFDHGKFDTDAQITLYWDTLKEKKDKEVLSDGIYKVDAKMLKTNGKDLSMANDAIAHKVKLTVKDGKYYVTLNLKAMNIPFGGQTFHGYLNKIQYIENGTEKDVTVNQVQKNTNGDIVSDEFGSNYPDLVTFPLTDEAVETGIAPMQVFIPIMDSIASGMGTQKMNLSLDFTSAVKTTADDKDFSSGDVTEEAPKKEEQKPSTTVQKPTATVQKPTATQTTTTVKLAAVTGLKVKNSSKKTVTVTWKKVKGATGYVVYRATKKNGKYKAVKTITKASTTKFKNKKLKKKKTYYYKVRAIKKAGKKVTYSKYSKAVSVKIKK